MIGFIPNNGQEEGQIYMTVLNKLGIIANIYPRTREIRIMGQAEIKKVNDYSLFKLHKERSDRLAIGWVNTYSKTN